ncbi:hypothetical protein GCM10023215_56310 [Pseudonocardia yuanmonensis]|uniref:IclR-ED domain-containing protein n=1 Tax=Pseudonocardia yuanmonensis TaxID=1095914 RepID=A0ABP8XL03_9PSEU
MALQTGSRSSIDSPSDQADVHEFLEETPAIRENGYAFDRVGPSAPDFSAVSCPVNARNGSVLAGLAGPAEQVTRDQRLLAKALTEATRQWAEREAEPA